MPLHHSPGALRRTGAVQRRIAGGAQLKTPWRDGTTHLVMSSMEFMQRLAALVPRPRLHCHDRFAAVVLCNRMPDVGRLPVYTNSG